MTKFRIRQQDKETLSKLNSRIRRKENRLNKEFGRSMGLPIMDINEFTSRKQFNDYLEQGEFNVHRNQHRYVKNQHGFVISRRQYNQMKRQDSKYQRKQRRQLEKIRSKKLKQMGEDTGFTVGDFDNDRTMGRDSLDYLKLRPFDFDSISDFRAFEMKQRQIAQRSDPRFLLKKNQQFKENYLKSIREVLGAGGDKEITPDEVGYKLHQHIESMSLEQFMDIYLTEYDISIGFIYSGNEQQAKVDRLHDIFGVERNDWDQFDYGNEEIDPEVDPRNYWL